MLSIEQNKILKNMILAMFIAILLVILAFTFPIRLQIGRIEYYLLALSLPTLSYIVGIGRIAGLRFFDESVSNPLVMAENIRLNIMKQYLSNTHEQLFLAVIIYLLLSWNLPVDSIYLVLLFSLCFVFGRILFANGYISGASGRSLGFALTFYSNVVGFIIGFVFLVKNIS